jgi:NADH-ubiquinone oxidoreductase chain 5
MFVGPGSDLLGSALFVHPDHVYLVDGEFSLPLIIKNLPLVVTILGAGGALVMYH